MDAFPDTQPTITKGLGRRLNAFDKWSLQKNPSGPKTRHVTNACVGDPTGCPPASFLIKIKRPISFVLWHILIAGRITIELPVHRLDHQVTGKYLKGAHIPCSRGGLKLMYSQLTSISTQPGLRALAMYSRHSNTMLWACH